MTFSKSSHQSLSRVLLLHSDSTHPHRDLEKFMPGLAQIRQNICHNHNVSNWSSSHRITHACLKRCLEFSTSLENGKRWQRSSVSQRRHLSICCLFVKGPCLRERIRGIEDTRLTGREETGVQRLWYLHFHSGAAGICDCRRTAVKSMNNLWNPQRRHISEANPSCSRLTWRLTFEV